MLSKTTPVICHKKAFKLDFLANLRYSCQPCGHGWRADKVPCRCRGGDQNAFEEYCFVAFVYRGGTANNES